MKLVFATMIRTVAGAGCRSATWNATSCYYYAPNPDSTHHQPPTNSTPAAGKRPPHDQQATDLQDTEDLTRRAGCIGCATQAGPRAWY